MKRISISLLTLSLAVCSSVAVAGNPPAPVPVTGQTNCYNEEGTKVSCTGTGQDGEIRAGFPWPAGRFTVDENFIVTDKLTGLMWLVAPTDLNDDIQSWTKTLTSVASTINAGTVTSNGGFTDWRVPNVNELASLINYGQVHPSDYLVGNGFPEELNSQQIYWTSTSNPAAPGDVILNLNVYFGHFYNNGRIASPATTDFTGAVYTRNAEAGAVAVPKTGQQTSYATNDDGALQTGVAWPSPRFSSTANQTVTDNLTGLMWGKLGNLVMSRDPAFDQDGEQDGRVTWSHALAYIKKLNAERYLGYDDWRLPNINELKSLVNTASSDNLAWLNSQGFQDVQDGYWSSTTFMYDPREAWIFSTLPTTELAAEPYVTADWKDGYNYNYYVLPVRRVLHGTVETVVTPGTVAFCATGGAGSAAVEAGGPWTATAADSSWVGITTGSGSGDGPVTFNVAANTSGAPRNTTVTVDNKTITVLQAKAEFDDNPNTRENWAYPYTCAIYAKGITQGCNGGASYCPIDSVTREQMAAFIVRAKFTDNFTINSQTPYYNDVQPGTTYFRYIQKMREEGLAAPNPSYNPSGLVTREQMAAFIIRSLQGESFTYSQAPYFSDVPDTSVYYKYVQKMKDMGLTANNGVYDASGLVTRAQMAAFLSRAFLGMK